MSILKNLLRGLFKDEFANLNSQLDYYKKENSKVTRHNEMMNKQISDKDALIAKGRGDNERLTSEIQTLKKELEDRKERFDILESEAKDLSIDIAHSIELERSAVEGRVAAEKHAQEVDKTNEALKESLTDKCEECEMLGKKIRDLTLQVNQTTEELNQKKESLAILEGERLSLATNVGKAISERDDAQALVEKREIEIKSLQQAEQDLKGALEAKGKECAELQQKLDSILNKPVDEDLINALKAENKKLKMDVENMVGEVQSLNEQLSGLKRDLDAARAILVDKNEEIDKLKHSLNDLAQSATLIDEIRTQLNTARARVSELEGMLKRAPKLSDIEAKDKLIQKLQQENKKLKEELDKNMANTTPSTPTEEKPKEVDELPRPDGKESAPISKPSPEPKTAPVAKRYRQTAMPYQRIITQPTKAVLTKDFPKIENENQYAAVNRMIDRVYNAHTNRIMRANDIFNKSTAEELTKMSYDLEEAVRLNKPYLLCPSCGQMVKISSRRSGWGGTIRDVQFFTHAVKNVYCELKKEQIYNISVDGQEEGLMEDAVPRQFKELIRDSLLTNVSAEMGFSDVKMEEYIHSTELSLMKARRPDIWTKFNNRKLVFELVTPTTNIKKVHDRDIFYLINNIHVVWVFGLESAADYNELMRSVSKDIHFTSKRNAFVFDIEAQEASRHRKELILKCNWLDEDGEWYFQNKKNGKNGILISMNELKFDEDGCRPYYIDADTPYFEKHPTAERPAKLDREKLKKELEETWKCEAAQRAARDEMEKTGKGIQLYKEDDKWGFKYNDTVFIEPTFFDEPVITGEYIKVKLHEKYGVVDRFGSMVLNVAYDHVEILPNGYIIYSYKNEWKLFGVFDPLARTNYGDKIIQKTISEVSGVYYVKIVKSMFVNQPAEEFYFLSNEIFKKDTVTGKWSLWLSKGEQETDKIWDELIFDIDDQIKAKVDGRTQVLSYDGELIEEEKYKTVIKPALANGNKIVVSFENKWGLIDANDEVIVEPAYASIARITDDYLKFQSNGLWGIMTSRGVITSQPKFKSIGAFSGSYFEVTMADPERSWETILGRVDVQGNALSRLVSKAPDGTLITSVFGKYGTEYEGKEMIKHQYDGVDYWAPGRYRVKKNNKYGVVDSDGNILVPIEALSISSIENNKAVVKLAAYNYTINHDGDKIADETIELHDGFKKVKMCGKWGIIGPDNKVLVNYEYDEISTFRGRLLGIINGGLKRLRAYYPHNLQMTGAKTTKWGKAMVRIGGVDFRLLLNKQPISDGLLVKVYLINWTSSAIYPDVELYNEEKSKKIKKAFDKDEDFESGVTYEAVVDNQKTKTRKSKLGMPRTKILKGFAVKIGNSSSYISRKDVENARLNVGQVSIGTKLLLTKMGYNEELDRTIWKITMNSL